MSKHKVPRDKESGLPEKYTTGKPSTDEARARHFARGKEKDPKDPSAYESAPGDKTAKTRESQYTRKYKEMFGEDMITESANVALKKKAEKSGISLGTLKTVYKRGVAAWRTGHRPGTTPQQWGMARVNSYITKGKTYHTADKDLREDYEYEMARNELKTAMRAVERLMRHFQGESDIEPWVQSKLTKATDYLDTLADYMDSSDRTVKEAKVLSNQAKKIAITDTTMPTADRSVSGGSKGIIESDEKIIELKPGMKRPSKNSNYTSKVGLGASKNPAIGTLPWHKLSKLVAAANESVEQGTTELVANYKNMTPGQECSTTSKTAKIVKKVVSEAAMRYDPVAGYRRGRPFRGGRRFKARTSGKSRRVDASRPTRTAGMLRRKMNRKAQKAMKRTMTVTARGT